MLTNNKKSCFAKGIAVMLAALMVLAVCLTGCTDKTARETADEAKTLATETADKLTEALKGYLKTSDAEATVNALIKDALKDAETIKDFATSKQLDDLAAKLANYVAKDDLNATIKAAEDADELEKGVVKLRDMENRLEPQINAVPTASGTVDFPSRGSRTKDLP